MAETVRTEVKSTFLSKINWASALGLAATIFALFGIDLDEDTQKQVIAGIAGVTTLAVWVIRTFFTKTVTPQVAAKTN